MVVDVPPDASASHAPKGVAEGALAGLRILDFSRAFSGPLCTMILGELGADVVKVERPDGGDETRTWPPLLRDEVSGYFAALNRSKRSVTLDLKHDRADEIVARLATWADVVVENFRPGVAERLGIGYDRLSAINPRLVYCSISGFGHTGPYRDRPGYDPILQAMGGLMGVTGERGGAPLKSMIPVADITAGLFASIATLTGVIHVRNTGRGQHVDLSMLDAMASITSTVGSFYLNTGVVPERAGRDNPMRVPSSAFECADGIYLQLVPNQRQWATFCQAIGAPDLASDARFSDNEARIEHQEELYARLRQIFASRDAADWYDLLVAAGIPAGPIHTLDSLFADPQVEHRKIVETVRMLDGLELRAIRLPLNLSETPNSIRSAPPALGQHTREIMADLGYTEEVIDNLSTVGAI